jgi:hypothetical protein
MKRMKSGASFSMKLGGRRIAIRSSVLVLPHVADVRQSMSEPHQVRRNPLNERIVRLRQVGGQRERKRRKQQSRRAKPTHQAFAQRSITFGGSRRNITAASPTEVPLH